MTTTSEIDLCNTIGKREFAITRESVGHNGKSLVAFNIARTFEIFIERSANEIL